MPGSAGRRGAAPGRAPGSGLPAIFAKADRGVRIAARDPRRRTVLAAAGLVAMALAVLATAAALAGATPLP